MIFSQLYDIYLCYENKLELRRYHGIYKALISWNGREEERIRTELQDDNILGNEGDRGRRGGEECGPVAGPRKCAPMFRPRYGNFFRVVAPNGAFIFTRSGNDGTFNTGPSESRRRSRLLPQCVFRRAGGCGGDVVRGAVWKERKVMAIGKGPSTQFTNHGKHSRVN